MLATPKTPVQYGTPQQTGLRLERMESQSKVDESVPATPKGELGAKRASFIEVRAQRQKFEQFTNKDTFF